MQITLTDGKKPKRLKACYSELINKSTQTIRYVPRVIGLMTSVLPCVKFRAAQHDKNKIKQMH